ncbi:glycosyl hydrolase [Glycomyces luteolus]|uniref:Glycosyl hydrolase n=1 Tax=Glycomyces luteolus TaxID=2670330 RepID=A0A9X3T4C3_9ACTN|nr:glycosyl hydrolase [Glycomyces luteolus]MDA1360880.1 glycosyl hydrolase [Glycomyces luteolus]
MMGDTDTRQSLRAGRGIVTALAVLPLLLAGFVIGYGVGAGGDRLGDTVGEAWQDGNGTFDHEPLAASFTATEFANPAPQSPSVLPVGFSADLGIAVAHLQFFVDEATLRPDHTAELRLPVVVPPDGEGMTVEVVSVHPVSCLCSLTAATAPPYGTVWDAVEVDAGATEVVFDVTGAIDAPGRYGFAVTSPDRDAYLELAGTAFGAGPSLRTISQVPPVSPVSPSPDPTTPSPDAPSGPTLPPYPSAGQSPTPPASGPPLRPESGQAEDTLSECSTDEKLVPECGALIGAAAGGKTSLDKEDAFLDFEATVERTQQIYHAYERADERLFPTSEQIGLTEDPEHPRTLFINWKPQMAKWAEIAEGDPEVDAYLDRLAAHINANFDKPFFFTVHHEPENDVVQQPGSGMEASDYPAMYRYVIERLRANGVDNLVSVMNYMGYLKWVEMPWHEELYPGDDVVDWIGLSGYGQALKDDGRFDFGELLDTTHPEFGWPGYYHWVAEQHPQKPMMLAEWGVFTDDQHPGHQQTVFEAAMEQMAHYPRLKAIVYFSSPNAEGRNSEVDQDAEALESFRALMRSPYLNVRLDLGFAEPPN